VTLPANLEGKAFGRLLVITEVSRDKHGSVIWGCLCECGGYTYVTTMQLNSGKTKSCGCLFKDQIKGNKNATTHGLYGTPEHTRQWSNRRNHERKVEVLTHYGLRGKLRCCAVGCYVQDIDLLTLDHKEDNGVDHRKAINSRGGGSTYRWILSNGFPEGFQTLCWNHQAKKALIRARANRKDGFNENIH
jgi:hypothetical protein